MIAHHEVKDKIERPKVAVTDIHGVKPSFSSVGRLSPHFAVNVTGAGAHIRQAPIVSRN